MSPWLLQTETIDLSEIKGKFGQGNGIFRRSNTNKSAHACVDSDGLPYVGQVGEQYFFGVHRIIVRINS